jgi:hypothetical protein
MPNNRKNDMQSERESEKRRPRGKTGRGDTFRDSERARQTEHGEEEWHERGDDRGERGETGEEGSHRR